MAEIQLILFDAANTLIHKPSLWKKIDQVLTKHNLFIESAIVQKNHKLISELITFPDRTSEEFYKKFNSELLYSLGIVPNQTLLSDLFNACSYLPWDKFDDTEIIKELAIDKAILSNFNDKLTKTIESLFPNIFSTIFISEKTGFAKPDIQFYQHAVDTLNIPPEKILYIGDSLKLDIQPATSIGMKAYLIDRNNYYHMFNYKIHSLKELTQLLHVK